MVHQAFPEHVVGTAGIETQAGLLLSISARAPLGLWQFAVGYSLDAPDMLPAGSVQNRTGNGPVPSIHYR